MPCTAYLDRRHPPVVRVESCRLLAQGREPVQDGDRDEITEALAPAEMRQPKATVSIFPCH
jgi:hypothetical protein